MTASLPIAPTAVTAFDEPVPAGGYAWWYLDALSDDGCHALTVIAFIGSVFSPYYAWARRGGARAGDPSNHCAINIALYATQGARGPTAWTMTERGAATLERGAAGLRIGPSELRHDAGSLLWTLHERGAPWPAPVRGRVRLHPLGWHTQRHRLDAAGLHTWQPMAPVARIEVELEQPALRWRGQAYLDGNRGQRTLEHDFSHWHWARAGLPGRRCAVLYDVTRSDGSQDHLALQFDARGRALPFEAPPHAQLPPSAWRVGRATRSQPRQDTSAASGAQVVQTLEDGPFYARSLVRTRLLDQDALAMHESLDMARWRSPLVQAMLPFRMPRNAGLAQPGGRGAEAACGADSPAP